MIRCNMQFDSLEFLLFVPVVFVIYWSMRTTMARNAVIVIASYFFYAWADWRFMGLLATVTTISYFAGRYIIKGNKRSKVVLYMAIWTELIILALFKYLNFFVESFSTSLRYIGLHVDGVTLNLLLPVGLSFYVFMTMSYVIDCHRRLIVKSPNILCFFAYVSFFPHLLAGPIDRARFLLPQMAEMQSFSFKIGSDGLRQILWGLLKKTVIADNCNLMIAGIWNDIPNQSSMVLLFGAFLYSIQIYFDFSGYSDIAIGLGKLFGIKMKPNFNYPYFSRNVSEFWRKWHMSLTSWFTEYMYIPLGGNRRGRKRTMFNTIVVFTLCGLWHGANWTFVVWGFLCGVMFIPILLQKIPKKYKNEPLHLNIATALKMGFTFIVITFSWIIFRAETMGQAVQYIIGIYRNMTVMPNMEFFSKTVLLLTLIVLTAEWKARDKEFALQGLSHLPRILRWIVYLSMIGVIFNYMVQNNNAVFIYQNF